MKKIYYLILLMMLGVGAMADTINIVVSGKAGGTFHARSMLMHDALVDMGYEVNLINAPVFANLRLEVAKSPITKAPPDVK